MARRGRPRTGTGKRRGLLVAEVRGDLDQRGRGEEAVLRKRSLCLATEGAGEECRRESRADIVEEERRSDAVARVPLPRAGSDGDDGSGGVGAGDKLGHRRPHVLPVGDQEVAVVERHGVDLDEHCAMMSSDATTSCQANLRQGQAVEQAPRASADSSTRRPVRIQLCATASTRCAPFRANTTASWSPGLP